MRGLKDRVAIIAGAAPGNIGAATAHRLAEEGAQVVVADLNEEAARAVAAAITAAGGIAKARRVDVTQEASYADLINFTVREFAAVDGLFNVAADLSANNLGRDTDVLSVPNDVWQHTIDVTTTGYMYGIRHALPIMIKQRRGSIVNTMSAVVWLGEAVRVSYQVAKGALSALTRHTATIGGRHGVRCNSVAPGVIQTAASKAVMTEAEVQYVLSAIRSPRLGLPEDIAATVAFLFSDDSAFINGHTIIADGGANLVD
jgi:NAD(P)-dependent dehydrogenase (short-subunit alcohol dehydrogenase family)